MNDETTKTTLPVARLARENENFRRVVITGPKSQVVLMSLLPGEEIGEEVHEGHDQILVFVEGNGTAIIDGEKTVVGPNDMTLVKDGVRHNFVNTGMKPLKLYTIYAPPEHEKGTVHRTKTEADEAEKQEH